MDWIDDFYVCNAVTTEDFFQDIPCWLLDFVKLPDFFSLVITVLLHFNPRQRGKSNYSRIRGLLYAIIIQSSCA